MKRASFIAAIAIVGLFAADAVWAQQGPGRGAGFGRIMGGEASAEVICDVLLLNEERSEEVKAIYLETMESQAGSMGAPQNWQNMSQEERMREFQAIRQRQADAVTEALSELLEEKESEAVHGVLLSGRMNVISEIRALRLIGVEEEHRAELLPSVFAVTQALPAFGLAPGGRQDGGQQEARAAYEEKLAEMTQKVEAVLSAGQVEAWKAKTQEVEEEQQRQREEMRQRMGGGAGGPGAGQPRGGGGGGRQ